MTSWISALLMILLLTQINSISKCEQYVKELIANLSSPHLNLTSIPLPSLMYSGITTNNPGQKYECQQYSQNSYNYYLVTRKIDSTETFTGLCVPNQCSRSDLEKTFGSYVNQVYDYPQATSTDPLFIVSSIFLGIWIALLIVNSIIVSLRETQENQYLKKNEQKSQHQDAALIQKHDEKLPLFNFYKGYCKIYQHSKQNRNPLSCILFLAVFSVLLSTEWSYRMTIAANQIKSLKYFNSFAGVFLCNFQIAFSVILFVLGVKLAQQTFKFATFHDFGNYFFDTVLTKWVTLFLLTLGVYFIMSFIDDPLAKVWSNNFSKDCSTVMWQNWFCFRNLQMDEKVCFPWFWLLQTDILLTILATPFIIIFKTKSRLGYVLMGLIVLTSLLSAYAILDNQSVVFEPYKIFTGSKRFTIDYQTSTAVRASSYFIGLIFGLFIFTNSQEQNQISNHHSKPSKLFTKIQRSTFVQSALHLIGLVLMIFAFLMIIPFLDSSSPSDSSTGSYLYLIFVPLLFLLGLSSFILPSYAHPDNKIGKLLKKILHWKLWDSLGKQSITFFLLGPAVIGFTTYSIQNSIYFDTETVLVYFLGDMVILYIMTVLALASIEYQLSFLSSWVRGKYMKGDQKASVVVIEQ